MGSDGEMVTVDAGGVCSAWTCHWDPQLTMFFQEYGGYVTDITRAWPVNGRFTDAQRDLYEMILEVQKRIVALCNEQAGLSLDGLQSQTESALREGLRKLGFDLSRNVRLLFCHDCLVLMRRRRLMCSSLIMWVTTLALLCMMLRDTQEPVD